MVVVVVASAFAAFTAHWLVHFELYGARWLRGNFIILVVVFTILVWSAAVVEANSDAPEGGLIAAGAVLQNRWFDAIRRLAKG